MARSEETKQKIGKTTKEKYDEIYLKKYGVTYYQYIGAKGGSKEKEELRKPKGFGADRDLAVRAGKVGGKISRRPKKEKE
jgi:general stress protein YciG